MSIPPAVSYPNSPGWSRWIERLRTATAGRFTILRELGRGGFAAVFLAQQHQPNRRVAIKLLMPTHLESEWALEHFRGESQKIAQWRHQSVVTIYEVHEEQDLFYFVMSYVEGASLHEIIQATGPLPVPVVKSVLAQMGSALWYAHRQGVTHRDIKPQNVLIDIDGGAVVADFGIAKQAGGTSHTVTGMIFGTAPYMAPEQCETGATSTQSDQYSLGIVVYEMLTGAPPFTGPATAVLVAHLQKPVPLLRTVRPDCPPELEAAIARMLSKKPDERFATIAEAVQAAGAAELPEFDAHRQAFAQTAKSLAAQQQAQVLDIVSIPPQIEVGDKIHVQATLRTHNGESVDTSGVKWSVENTEVAQIDPSRRALEAREPGFTTLFVKSGGLEKQIRVEVVPPRVHSIEITAPQHPVTVGEQVRLNARAVSKNGIPVEGAIKWLVDDHAIAMVQADGILQARAPGRTRIRAQLENVISEVFLDVALPTVAEVRVAGIGPSMTVGERRQASAIVLGKAGQALGDRTLHWISSDPHIATVTASGIVSAHQVGAVTITASCENFSAPTELQIAAPLAAAVEIQGPAVARVGDEVTMRAIVRDAMGRVMDGATVSWTSDEPDVARVSDTGLITTVAPGSAIISASIDGVSAATLLDVAMRGASTQTAQLRRTEAPAATALFTAGVANAAEPPLERQTTSAPSATAVATPAGATKSRAGLYAGVGIAAVLAIGAFVLFKPDSNETPGQATPETAAQPVAANTTPTTSAPAVPATDSTPAGGTGSNASTGASRPAPPATTPSPPTSTTARLAIRPPVSTRMTVGQQTQLSASSGQGAARNASWSSSNPAVATVSRTGIVQAAGAGRAYIRVRSGALADSVVFDVEAPVVATNTPAEPPAETKTATAPPVTAPPVTTTPTVDAAAVEAQMRDQVRHVVNQYATALQSAQIGNVLRVFPSMDKRTQDGWSGLFRSVRELDVNMRVVGPITINNNRGSARVNGEYLYINPSNRKRCRQEVVMVLDFERLDNNGQISGAKQESSKVSDC